MYNVKEYFVMEYDVYNLMSVGVLFNNNNNKEFYIRYPSQDKTKVMEIVKKIKEDVKKNKVKRAIVRIMDSSLLVKNSIDVLSKLSIKDNFSIDIVVTDTIAAEKFIPILTNVLKRGNLKYSLVDNYYSYCEGLISTERRDVYYNVYNKIAHNNFILSVKCNEVLDSINKIDDGLVYTALPFVLNHMCINIDHMDNTLFTRRCISRGFGEFISNGMRRTDVRLESLIEFYKENELELM